MKNRAQRRLSAISSNLDSDMARAIANARAEGLEAYASTVAEARVKLASSAALLSMRLQGERDDSDEHEALPGTYELCGARARLSPEEHGRLTKNDATVQFSAYCVLRKSHLGDHECLGFTWTRGGRS